jgi:hypothetical protein
MSDRELTAWDKPLPRKEFTESYSIRRKRFEGETQEQYDTAAKKHDITCVFVADGVTAIELAKIASRSRIVSVQNANRGEDEAEMAEIAKALQGKVYSIMPTKSTDRVSVAKKVEMAVQAERTKLDKLMAYALEKGEANAIDFVEYGETVRKMLEAAGVTFIE